MANKHYKSNRGRATIKTTDKSKIVKAVALLLVVLAIAYVITSLALGGVWNPFNWKSKQKEKVETVVSGDKEPNKSVEGFLLVSDISESNGIQMFSETRATSVLSQTEVLTVSVTPANADVFSVTWTSDDSAVAVTPIEGEPMSAKLTLVHNFDSYITITCNVVSATTLTATCRVDLLRDCSNNCELSVSALKFGQANSIFVNEISIPSGTVSGDYIVKGNVDLQLSTEVESYINIAYGLPADDCSYDSSCSLSGNVFNLGATPSAVFYGNNDVENFRKYFSQACRNYDNACKVGVNVDYVYNGKVYKTFYLETYVNFDYSTYSVPADSVTITPDNPVLGT